MNLSLKIPDWATPTDSYLQLRCMQRGRMRFLKRNERPTRAFFAIKYAFELTNKDLS